MKTDDPTTNAVLWLIERNDYAVAVTESVGIHEATATDETGERFIVRAADRYQAVCLLAEKVGIDLEDS